MMLWSVDAGHRCACVMSTDREQVESGICNVPGVNLLIYSYDRIG